MHSNNISLEIHSPSGFGHIPKVYFWDIPNNGDLITTTCETVSCILLMIYERVVCLSSNHSKYIKLMVSKDKQMLTAHSKHIAEIHLDGTNSLLIFSALFLRKQALSRVPLCISPDLGSIDSYRQIPHTIFKLLKRKWSDFQDCEKHAVTMGIEEICSF